jgi:hypothetical protein
MNIKDETVFNSIHQLQEHMITQAGINLVIAVTLLIIIYMVTND